MNHTVCEPWVTACDRWTHRDMLCVDFAKPGVQMSVLTSNLTFPAVHGVIIKWREVKPFTENPACWPLEGGASLNPIQVSQCSRWRYYSCLPTHAAEHTNVFILQHVIVYTVLFGIACMGNFDWRGSGFGWFEWAMRASQVHRGCLWVFRALYHFINDVLVDVYNGRFWVVR